MSVDRHSFRQGSRQPEFNSGSYTETVSGKGVDRHSFRQGRRQTQFQARGQTDTVSGKGLDRHSFRQGRRQILFQARGQTDTVSGKGLDRHSFRQGHKQTQILSLSTSLFLSLQIYNLITVPSYSVSMDIFILVLASISCFVLCYIKLKSHFSITPPLGKPILHMTNSHHILFFVVQIYIINTEKQPYIARVDIEKDMDVINNIKIFICINNWHIFYDFLLNIYIIFSIYLILNIKKILFSKCTKKNFKSLKQSYCSNIISVLCFNIISIFSW